tara:strand:+ start:293 stop:1354 length:1062 start_codon:yes stop_codon:yes gene_type:complete
MVIPQFIHMCANETEARVRGDAGACIRASYRGEMEVEIMLDELDGSFLHDMYQPGLTPIGKYHKMNTQYIGIRDALPRYEEFIRDGPSFVTDTTFATFMMGKTYVVYVENGILGVFRACHTCGKRSDKPSCHSCYMRGKRECDKCALVDDVRRMHKCAQSGGHEAYLCFNCYNAEEVDCDKCGKTCPRGHVCVPPENMVEDTPCSLGRPREITGKRYFPLGNVFSKGMIMCNLGCPPQTVLTDRSWKRHVKRKHPEKLGITGKLYKCKVPNCNYLGCNDKNQFRRHMLSHTTARKFVCRFCKKTYKQSEGLSSHYSRVHPVLYAKFKKSHYHHDATEKMEKPMDQLARIVLGI